MKDLNKEREAFEKISQFKYLLEVCEWSEEQECYINESGDPDFEYFADACNGGLTAFLTQCEDIERLKAELEKVKAQVVPDGYVLVPKDIPDRVVSCLENSSFHWGDRTRDHYTPIYSLMVEAASESGDEG